MDQTPGQLVIVGRHIADDMAPPINLIPDDERCVVVVEVGIYTAPDSQFE